LIGVIPCAGYGSRLSPFAKEVPKPLIPIGGKPLVEYPLALMKGLEPAFVVLIISSHTREVQEHLGDSYDGLAIEYVVQDPPRGLLDAVYQAREYVMDKFITLLSDEVYVGCRHRKLVEYWRDHPEIDGLVGYLGGQSWDAIKKNYSIVARNGSIAEFEEKPKHPVNSLLGTGTWGLTRTFFDYAALTLTNNPPGKRSFVDALQLMADDNHVIQGYDLGGSYVNVNSPADIGRAELLVR
jgi:NDP-sugar pyrophosphorylase family protein